VDDAAGRDGPERRLVDNGALDLAREVESGSWSDGAGRRVVDRDGKTRARRVVDLLEREVPASERAFVSSSSRARTLAARQDAHRLRASDGTVAVVDRKGLGDDAGDRDDRDGLRRAEEREPDVAESGDGEVRRRDADADGLRGRSISSSAR